MLYKSDWEEAQRRLEAWWECEVIERAAIAVEAPRAEPIPGRAHPGPAGRERLWTDIDYRLDLAEAAFARTYYGGEAFPCLDTGLGPGTLGVLLGAKPRWMPETIWYEPVIHDLSARPTLRYHPEGRWWTFCRRLVEEAMRRGEGRFPVPLPDLIENLDTLAALRGTEKTLIDLIDNPSAVHQLQEQIVPLYFRYYDQLYEMVEGPRRGCGFISFNVWAHGRMAKIQCDIGALISPRQFEQFALPYFVQQCQGLEYVLWHLDGKETMAHLDMILALPNLKAVQWVPGARGPSGGSREWYELYRKILSAGKALTMFAQPQEVEPLVREFGPNGLLILTRVETEQEAEDLLRQARRWRKH